VQCGREQPGTFRTAADAPCRPVRRHDGGAL
jgi:hypothetical protein